MPTHHGTAMSPWPWRRCESWADLRRATFIYLAAGAIGAVASAGVAWSLVDSMNPAADTLALSTTDVNIAPIAEGMGIVTMWQGKPVFVRHRTAAEISEAQNVKLADRAT